jgi:hypothetical protein
MMRLKAYRQTDIEVGSYRKPQEAQMTSTMVECLQGIQIAKEAAAPDKDRSGNLANNDEHFTELMMQIQDILCTQMPYGGSIISHNTSTNDGLSSDICMRPPRGSLGVIRLVWGCFGAFIPINSKYRICIRKISCLHALYQCQPVLGIPTTAMDLVGI